MRNRIRPALCWAFTLLIEGVITPYNISGAQRGYILQAQFCRGSYDYIISIPANFKLYERHVDLASPSKVDAVSCKSEARGCWMDMSIYARRVDGRTDGRTDGRLLRPKVINSTASEYGPP